MRGETLKFPPGVYRLYLSEYVEAAGTLNFLDAFQNYPDLKGVQTNLYKCFLPQAWDYGGAQEGGVSAFVHPEGGCTMTLEVAISDKDYIRY